MQTWPQLEGECLDSIQCGAARVTHGSAGDGRSWTVSRINDSITLVAGL